VYSETTETVVASIDPIPRPERNLNITTSYKELDSAVIITLNEIIIIEIRIIFLLPILSAKGAKIKAPMAIPKTPELKTIPSSWDEKFIDDEIIGAVYEIINTSIPSIIFRKKQINII